VAVCACRTRDVRQHPPVRAAELKFAVRLSFELVALLMDGAMMTATKHGEVRERGWSALSPVMYVMALAEPDDAARETAAAVSVV
jgi:hypothetical protein